MPTWTVILGGDPADLDALVALSGGVVRDGADVVFRSADLDTLTEPAAVEQVATQRIEILKGLLRVMTGDKRVRTVTTGGLRREENGRRSEVLVTSRGDYEMQGGVKGDTGAWLAASLRDPTRVGWALQLFAGEPTPAALYNVFEVIQDDLKAKNKAVASWTTPDEIKRFKGTANSPYHLGVLSRHGVKRKGKRARKRRAGRVMGNPMSVREMRDFIRGLLVKWLDSK